MAGVRTAPGGGVPAHIIGRAVADPPITVRAFPSSDQAFRRAVEQAAADARSGPEMEERLRSAYPRVRASERGLSHEPRLLYVYRDGGFAPTRSDEWWTAGGVARARIDARSGRFIDANEHWGELLGSGGGDVAGRHYLEYVLGDARDVADALFATLAEQPEIRTDILARRRDGTTILLEVRAVRTDGEIDIAYRRSPAERRRDPRPEGVAQERVAPEEDAG